MCLYPLTIRNPTKVVNTYGGQLLRMNVPCGRCAECLKAKRNEWYVRTHYEMMNTFAKGGYVYFDTLTYAPEYLPMLSHFIDLDKYGLSDFSCFNHQHFKLFLKRLRRMIAYHYGVKKDAFRYFLTTEYGEDDRYTHRPHYHILFFVYADIEPLNFSQMVADCWQYGRTDGFPFKPAPYVYQHVYGKDCGFGSNKDFKTTSSVCMYVSKYITKSSKFCKKLEKRLSFIKQQLMKYYANGSKSLTDEDRELIDDLRRNIDMFHRQSQGFGVSYLEDMTPTQLMFLAEDKVVMQDRNAIVKTYPMPMYYKRKLYYELKKHDDNTYFWQLTEAGLSHYFDAKVRKFDSVVLKYMDIVRNCKNQDLINKFFTLLDDRDIRDYVLYVQYYQGRHRDSDAINYKTRTQKPLTDEEDNINDWHAHLRISLRPYAYNDSNVQVDEAILRAPILTEKELQKYEEECYRHGHFPELLSNSRSELLNDYINLYTFNENSDPKFRDFDKISVLLTIMSEEQRDNTQMAFDYLEELKSRYKILFNFNL